MYPTCELHRHHTPKPLTEDWHHIIPRAWQRAYLTAFAGPPPGFTVTTTAAYGDVWQSDGARLCPTGHHNVHALLVDLMRGRSKARKTTEQKMAAHATELWAAAVAATIPNPVGWLTERKLWGQI